MEGGVAKVGQEGQRSASAVGSNTHNCSVFLHCLVAGDWASGTHTRHGGGEVRAGQQSGAGPATASICLASGPVM